MEHNQQDYILQTPINYFGIFIPAGTHYVHVSPDNYWPIVNGARCPNYQLSFMVVWNNETYFQKAEVNKPLDPITK